MAPVFILINLLLKGSQLRHIQFYCDFYDCETDEWRILPDKVHVAFIRWFRNSRRIENLRSAFSLFLISHNDCPLV